MDLNITVSEAKNVRELHETIEKLTAQNKKLKEALRFYADRNSWRYSGDDKFDCTINHKDASEVITGKQKDKVGGKLARAALKEVGNV